MDQPEPLLAIAGLVFSVATLTVLLLVSRAQLATPTALLLALTSLVALLALLTAPLEPLLALAGLVVFPVATLTVLYWFREQNWQRRQRCCLH